MNISGNFDHITELQTAPLPKAPEAGTRLAYSKVYFLAEYLAGPFVLFASGALVLSAVIPLCALALALVLGQVADVTWVSLALQTLDDTMVFLPFVGTFAALVGAYVQLRTLPDLFKGYGAGYLQFRYSRCGALHSASQRYRR